MAKRRTKKQKVRARNKRVQSKNRDVSEANSRLSFSYSENTVKGQTKKELSRDNGSKSKRKSASTSGRNSNLASIKKDVIKSLSLASLILGLELVIYYFWR